MCLHVSEFPISSPSGLHILPVLSAETKLTQVHLMPYVKFTFHNYTYTYKIYIYIKDIKEIVQNVCNAYI